MKLLAIFLVCTVICAAWLIWGSQKQYDTDPDDDDPYQDENNWGI